MKSTGEPGRRKPRTFLWLILFGICFLSVLTYTGALACGWGNNSPWISTASAHGCAAWMEQSQNCASPTAISCGNTNSRSQICVLPTTPNVQTCDPTDPTCITPTITTIVLPTATPPVVASPTAPSPVATPPVVASPTAPSPAATPPAVASPTAANSSYTLNVVDPENLLSSTLISQLQAVFQYSYPQLVQRFGSTSSPQSVTLTAAPSIASASTDAPPGSVTVAETSGSNIEVNATFQNQNPTYLGWLTHELTHVVQGYTHLYAQEAADSNVPTWFSEGMAEYGRYYYAPSGANASFNPLTPPTSADSGPQSYTTAARFLIWLQQHTSSTIVDQLNKAVQSGQDFTSTFQQITGGTVNQLWAQYVANPSIS